jgi:RNA polymerase sigma-70 factor (ECF subfamily)
LTRHEVGDEASPASGRFATVNGAPGIVTYNGSVLTVMSFRFDDGRIAAIDAVRNPEKLSHVRL